MIDTSDWSLAERLALVGQMLGGIAAAIGVGLFGNSHAANNLTERANGFWLIGVGFFVFAVSPVVRWRLRVRRINRQPVDAMKTATQT